MKNMKKIRKRVLDPFGIGKAEPEEVVKAFLAALKQNPTKARLYALLEEM